MGTKDKLAGGWSQSGEIRPGDLSGSVGMQIVFPEGGNYTVQVEMNFTRIRPMNLGEVLRAEVEVTWTVEGNQVRRVVSAGNGVSISGTAQAVSVKVSDTSHITGAAISETYTASISVAKGTRASTQQPPFYEPSAVVTTNAGPSGVDFLVPLDVGAISVFLPVSPVPGGGPIAEFGVIAIQLNSGGTKLKVYDPRDYEWVPLSPGCTAISLQLAAGVPALFANAVFGIDG